VVEVFGVNDPNVIKTLLLPQRNDGEVLDK